MDADAMTYLGMTLATAPRAFGWGHLANWVRHLPPQSATMRWAAEEQSRRKSKADGSRQSFGSSPLPVSEFDNWYYGGE